MLKYRLTLGPLMIAALLGLIWADDRLGAVRLGDGGATLPAGLLIFAVFMILIVLGGRELADIFRAKGVAANRFMLSLAGAAVFAAMYLTASPGARNLSPQSPAVALTVIVVVFLLALLVHAWRHGTQGAAGAGAAAAFAAVYMGAMPGFFLLLRQHYSAWIIAAVILTTKNCDTGAFTAGRLFGKHKLIPWLSPGKTWEGLAGGVALSIITALLLAGLSNANDWPIRYIAAHTATADALSAAGTSGDALSPLHIPLWYAALVGALLAVIGHLGDLLASLLKRDAGVKDSGKSIPGFGGILDVCDSPLIIAPLAYWLMLPPLTW